MPRNLHQKIARIRHDNSLDTIFINTSTENISVDFTHVLAIQDMIVSSSLADFQDYLLLLHFSLACLEQAARYYMPPGSMIDMRNELVQQALHVDMSFSASRFFFQEVEKNKDASAFEHIKDFCQLASKSMRSSLSGDSLETQFLDRLEPMNTLMPWVLIPWNGLSAHDQIFLENAFKENKNATRFFLCYTRGHENALTVTKQLFSSRSRITTLFLYAERLDEGLVIFIENLLKSTSRLKMLTVRAKYSSPEVIDSLLKMIEANPGLCMRFSEYTAGIFQHKYERDTNSVISFLCNPIIRDFVNARGRKNIQFNTSDYVAAMKRDVIAISTVIIIWGLHLSDNIDIISIEILFHVFSFFPSFHLGFTPALFEYTAHYASCQAEEDYMNVSFEDEQKIDFSPCSYWHQGLLTRSDNYHKAKADDECSSSATCCDDESRLADKTEKRTSLLKLISTFIKILNKKFFLTPKLGQARATLELLELRLKNESSELDYILHTWSCDNHVLIEEYSIFSNAYEVKNIIKDNEELQWQTQIFWNIIAGYPLLQDIKIDKLSKETLLACEDRDITKSCV